MYQTSTIVSKCTFKYYTSINSFTKYLAVDIGFQIKAQRSNTKTDNLHPEKV